MQSIANDHDNKWFDEYTQASARAQKKQEPVPTYHGWPTVGPSDDDALLKTRQAMLKGHVDWVHWAQEASDATKHLSSPRRPHNSNWWPNYGIATPGGIVWGARENPQSVPSYQVSHHDAAQSSRPGGTVWSPRENPQSVPSYQASHHDVAQSSRPLERAPHLALQALSAISSVLQDGFRGYAAGEELKAQCGNDALAFFGDAEVLPEPKSSISGAASDGLGGYKTEDYAMDDSGKDPGFVKA